ncbi:MAG: prepilin-type N-terminal cleavage/methylation domain-containing protein [Planctomycetes bacterium]|nr:prepilin-type N-terminal cleavage/methylation domain-containing protein [Planctomycetota bacterium]
MRRRSGFTLIELLVVVAIIALLISILLPSLQGAREQGKRAKCLANMKSIAQGSVAYATEDKKELVAPIHQMAVSTLHSQGFTGTVTPQDPAEQYPAPFMAMRLAIPTSFGGRTPQVKIPTSGGGGVTVMMDPEEQPGGSDRWLAKTRPLNKYVMGSNEQSDNKNMEMYRCPADTGYPQHRFMRDCPVEATDIPTYDMLGNSYRINVAGYFWISGSSGVGQFSIGVWGKQLSKLSDTGKVAMYCEPIFYNASRVLGPVQNAPDIVGWHKAVMKDNVAYADGSARSTLAVQMIDWPAQLLAQMNVATDNPWYYYLRRGDTWRTDTYPTPGSRIVMRNAAGAIVTPGIPPGNMNKWPYSGHNTID